MRNKMCLTASDAEKIVAGCKAEAAKNKWNVSIAVVDDGGFLVHLERLDGAVAQSAMIATAKAQTAAATRTPTKALEDIVKDRPATVAFPGTSWPFRGDCRSCIRANASARWGFPAPNRMKMSRSPAPG